MIVDLLEAGCLDHVCLSGDMGKVNYLPAYGGEPGLAYILTGLKRELLREQNLLQCQIYHHAPYSGACSQDKNDDSSTPHNLFRVSLLTGQASSCFVMGSGGGQYLLEATL